MSDSSVPSHSNDSTTLEQDLLKLEEAVRALEVGGLPLDEILERYEQGIRHYRRCHSRLKEAEMRIESIRIDGEGRPVLEPFDHQSSMESAIRNLKIPAGEAI